MDSGFFAQCTILEPLFMVFVIQKLSTHSAVIQMFNELILIIGFILSQTYPDQPDQLL